MTDGKMGLLSVATGAGGFLIGRQLGQPSIQGWAKDVLSRITIQYPAYTRVPQVGAWHTRVMGSWKWHNLEHSEVAVEEDKDESGDRDYSLIIRLAKTVDGVVSIVIHCASGKFPIAAYFDAQKIYDHRTFVDGAFYQVPS